MVVASDPHYADIAHPTSGASEWILLQNGPVTQLASSCGTCRHVAVVTFTVLMPMVLR